MGNNNMINTNNFVTTMADILRNMLTIAGCDTQRGKRKNYLKNMWVDRVGEDLCT